jgi:hypothetical protein
VKQKYEAVSHARGETDDKSKQQEKLGYADYIGDCPAEPRKKIEMLVHRSGVRRSNKLVDRPNEHDEKMVSRAVAIRRDSIYCWLPVSFSLPPTGLATSPPAQSLSRTAR